MSRWGKGARWTADDLARHQAFYSRGEALPVIEEGARTTQQHARWKARQVSTAEGPTREGRAGRGLQPDDHPTATPLYALVGLCRSAGLPEPLPEYPFADAIGRKWRADYCWPEQRLILECDGGLFVQGRHSRGAGRLADMEKLSEAAIMGYRVIYTTPDEMASGKVMDRVMRALRPMPEAA